MKEFAPLQLTAQQKTILTAYGNACQPVTFCLPPIDRKYIADLEMLKDAGLIDRAQNHISDRGAAYLFTQCGFPFDRFITIHKWQDRLGSRIAVGKMICKTRQAENYYHLQRYKLLIKYNVFNPNNAEGDPANMGIIMTELFANLIDSDLFNWQDLKEFLVNNDPFGDQELRKINNKESFSQYIKKSASILSG